MQVHLSSGNYHIIASGDVFMFDSAGDLSIHITDNGRPFIHLVLTFLKDASGQRIEQALVEDRLVLSCYNFKDEGTGMTSPWRIANANGKDVFITFWSYLEGSKDDIRPRHVKYTVFYEK